MGVTGLWKLIDPAGKEVPLETLENKVLAVDISIWLHQVVKGFQDNKSSALANAHLLGLFHRLCKLLFFRIKPVFVFDGGVPRLKRETIAKRSEGRNKLLNEADRLQSLILQSLAKEKVVQQALGPNAVKILSSPVKPKAKNDKPEKDDIFKLPDLPEDSDVNIDTTDSSCTDLTTESESSFEESGPRYAYSNNIQSIDVTSTHFKTLPADVRHEILTDIKETRKQSSWGRLHELPVESNDFCTFQMKRLLKRRQVQVSLEEAEQQMGGKSLTLNELRNFLSEEGVITASTSKASKHIASDENTRFLLVKDLKKAIEKAENEVQSEQNTKQEETKPIELLQNSNISDNDELGEEYDTDLQKAIAMSLECSGVYGDSDYEDSEIKMNREQRQRLKTAAQSLARQYMIEYGGMNDDEVKELLEETQALDNSDITSSFIFQHNDRYILKGEACTPYKNLLSKIDEKIVTDGIKSDTPENSVTKEQYNNIERTKSPAVVEEISDSDDSDLIEIDEDELNLDKSKNASHNKIEIVVDLQKEMDSDDDIFADIFLPNDEMISASQNPPDESCIDLTIHSKINATECCATTLDFKSPIIENFVDLTNTPSSQEAVNPELTSVGGTPVTGNCVDLTNSQSSLEVDSTPPVVSLQSDSESKYTATVTANSVDLNNTQSSMEVECTPPIVSLESDSETKNQAIVIANCVDVNNTQSSMEVECSPPIVSLESDSETKCMEARSEDNSEMVKEQLNDSIKSSATNSRIFDEQIKEDKVNPEDILQELKSEITIVSQITLDAIKTGEPDLGIHETLEKDLGFEGKSILNINPVSNSATDILEDLKRQTDDIKNISLESIKIIKPKSPKTPTKNCGQTPISNFFETEYIIKRTPEKPKEDESDTPKVKSPFFVRKTPGSSSEKKRKRQQLLDDETETTSRDKKASKMLFDKPEEDNADDLKLIEPTPIEIAAQCLRDNKSEQELQSMAKSIAKERREIEYEKNKQHRMGTSITDKMSAECMQLLRLFGVPYIVAPMEAEAQCAFLNASQLTDGTITDDSDIWLFGGRTVYKNFFDNKKSVMEYKVENIEKLFNVDRYKMIQLAILVGSDYTTGIHGIGAVTALEILASFTSTPMKDKEVTPAMSILSSLRKFREWLKLGKSFAGRNALRSKLKNVELSEGFPNISIVEAYLNPTVDENREKFSWGSPDVETIYEFAKKTFGWTRIKTDGILIPVLTKLKQNVSQSSLKKYFTVKSSLPVKGIQVSKRVQQAINKMSEDYKSDDDAPKTKKTRKTKKANQSESNDPPKRIIKRKTKASATCTTTDLSNEEPSTSKGPIASNDVPSKIPTKVPILPDANRKIPQKEKNILEIKKNKEKAIELFKKAQDKNKSKKAVH